MESTISNANEQVPEEEAGQLLNVTHLIEYLKRVTDGRKRRGRRYPLEIILALLVLGKLCGENKVYGIADWVQERSKYLIDLLGLQLKRPCLPHHSTYRRILSEEISAEELDRLFGEYLLQQASEGQGLTIVLDGKTLRGTITRNDPFGVHLLAAYVPEKGIVLMQMEVEKEKENEIVVAPKLLQCLDLRNHIVIADAMHTQRELSTQIVEGGGNYVWIVKDNQAKTRQAIEQCFTPQPPKPGFGCPPNNFASAQTLEKQAGRIEKRRITVSDQLNDYLDWPHLGQVFQLERCVTHPSSGVVEHQVQYGLTSLTPQQAPPERLLAILRSEWSIENGLHHRRDTTYQEDQSRFTNKRMAHSMASLNNLVLSLLNLLGHTNHARARRSFNAHPHLALSLIFGL